MRAGQVANLVRISHRNLEARLARLLDADARLSMRPHRARMRSLNGRRLSRARRAVVIVLVDVMRVGRTGAAALLGRHRGADHHLLLLRRDGRSVLTGFGAIVCGGGSAEGTQRTEGIVDGFEAGRLGGNESADRSRA